MCYRLESGGAGRRKPDIDHRQDEKEYRETDRGVHKKSFKTTFRIVTTEIAPKSTPQSRTAVLKEDGHSEEDGHDRLSDEENSHTVEYFE